MTIKKKIKLRNPFARELYEDLQYRMKIKEGRKRLIEGPDLDEALEEYYEEIEEDEDEE